MLEHADAWMPGGHYAPFGNGLVAAWIADRLREEG